VKNRKLSVTKVVVPAKVGESKRNAGLQAAAFRSVRRHLALSANAGEQRRSERRGGSALERA
jgi:hypothetical protein